MATHKVTLKKMASGDATFVSMVGRAANRIPFRVIKESKENGMFNLGNLGKVLKGEKEVVSDVPELMAVVVEKSDLIPQITEGLKEKGFDVSNVVENEDNTVSFVQKESVEGDDLTLIRMDDNVVLVMKGFSAYSQNMTKFNDIVKAQGFYQGLNVATDAFRTVISESLYSSDSAEEVVKKVDSTVNDFGAYVRALAQGLPAAAFTVTNEVASVYKAEAEKVEKAEKEEKEIETAAAVVQKADEPDLTIVPDDVSKKDWDAMDDEGKKAHLNVQKSEAPAAETNAPALDVADLVKKTAEAVAGILKPQLDELSGKVEAVSNANAEMQKTVDSVVQKSDAIGKQVGATVLAAAPAADIPSNNVAPVQKQEDPRTGAFDTAMIRKQERRNR